MALRFTFLSKTYSLVGNCISVYSKNGDKLEYRFFENHEIAKVHFLKMYSLVA